jgi:hypothetical protein
MDGLSNQYWRRRDTLFLKEKLCTRQIALFSVLVAASLAVQLTKPFPFVEFTSLIIFSTGVVFGSLMGAFLGGLVMFVNGFLSPWGLAGLNMPFQMLGMGITGAMGGLYKMENNRKIGLYVEAAVLGAGLTLVYYLITNTGYAFQLAFVLSQIPLLEALVLSQIWGAVFTVLYTVSNTILFGIGAVPLVNTMQKLLGGGKRCQ